MILWGGVPTHGYPANRLAVSGTMNALQPFWLALQFLTRLPVPAPAAFSPRAAGRSLLFYPVVGLLIGLLLAVPAGLFDGAAAGPRAAVLLMAWALMTGALHLDGLADCADAWIGGHGSRERSFAILKDPRAGSAAVVVVVLVLLAKFAAIQNLLVTHDWEPIVWAPVAGRTSALALLVLSPYANPKGLAAGWLVHVPLRAAHLLVALVAFLLAWRIGMSILLWAAASVWAVRAMAMTRLGGVTGDVCGAAVELAETTLLLGAALR